MKIKYKVNIDKDNFLHFQCMDGMHEFQNRIYLFICLTNASGALFNIYFC
jgi:hypothetical protein